MGRCIRGGARPPTQSVIGYINAHRAEFGGESICRVLAPAGVAIAPSTYYAVKTGSPSARSLRDEWLKTREHPLVRVISS